MSQQDLYQVLQELRSQDSMFRTVKQINQALAARGYVPAGYANTLFSLMQMAKCNLIELEKPPKSIYREWSRRFRGKKQTKRAMPKSFKQIAESK